MCFFFFFLCAVVAVYTFCCGCWNLGRSTRLRAFGLGVLCLSFFLILCRLAVFPTSVLQYSQSPPCPPKDVALPCYRALVFRIFPLLPYDASSPSTTNASFRLENSSTPPLSLSNVDRFTPRYWHSSTARHALFHDSDLFPTCTQLGSLALVLLLFLSFFSSSSPFLCSFVPFFSRYL